MSDVILMDSGEREPKKDSFSEALSRRAMMEIQANSITAERRPRDIMRAYTAIMKEAERYSFAETAIYSYNQGGTLVEGPTIRMMEMISRNFRNLSTGWAELQRLDGFSLCQAWCHDIEANNPHELRFIVQHTRDKKGGAPVKLTNQQEINQTIANYCSRRLRTCIERQVPADLISECIKAVKNTIGRGDGKQTWEQRLRNMMLAFEGLGVSKEMIEHRLGHAADVINEAEFIELWGIYNSIKDKDAERNEYFEFKTADTTTITDINAKAAAQTDDQRRTDVIAKIRAKYKDRQEKGLSVANITVNMDTLETLKTNQLMAVLGMLSKSTTHP